jgi:Tol biopolymer transport system component
VVALGAVSVLLCAVAVVVGRLAAPPAAAQADDPAGGRIAYAGTEHLGLGVATVGSGPDEDGSDPLFGPGPAHFDRSGSARGDLLVFASLRDGPRQQVYLRGADGAVRRLTSDRDARRPRLSPDGAFVVFDSVEPAGTGGAVQSDLWRVNTDGTDLLRLTDTPADETSPDVSPDGRFLAFSGDHEPERGREIYRMSLADGATTRETDEPTGSALDPAWNPVDDDVHRNRIAYVLDDPETGVLAKMIDGVCDCGPLLGGEQASWRSGSPSWLPDGERVLFTSPGPLDGPPRVYRAVARSEEPAIEVLTEDRVLDTPTWLGPLDGGRVVVTRTNAPDRLTATLQDVRPDGGDPRDLGVTVLREDPSTDPTGDPLFDPAPGFDPWTERQSYTPDGRRIVVTRFEDSPAGRIQRIWLVEADGSDPRPLPLRDRGATDWDTDPAFSPDGRFLAFTRQSPGGVGSLGGVSRIVVADAGTGAVVGTLPGQEGRADAQPTWSADGSTIAFTRQALINGSLGNKHVWTAAADALEQQDDLSARHCPGDCDIIDDSPAFSPDGTRIAFNRKSGGGRDDERTGVLVASSAGPGCEVVLPVGLRDDPAACGRELPDTSDTGPYQPRDVAWNADATRMVLTARRGIASNAPERLFVLDLVGGALAPLGPDLPGRQKEPATQQSVDLAAAAPPSAPALEVGTATSVAVDVTNRGPSPSPGTAVTVSVPTGLALDGLTTGRGTCDTAALRCDLGVLEPGAVVVVTAAVTGAAAGQQEVGWSAAGTVVDPSPADNAATTVVPVVDAQPPETTVPPTPVPPEPPAPPPPPPPSPLPPLAGPALTVGAQPQPGFVGGRITVTYTARNGANALATGLRVSFGLPRGVPVVSLPPGCSAAGCALPDLAPGSTAVLRIVLAPNAALDSTVIGELRTTGTDANPADNRATTPLRVRQPRIVAVPPIGKPGFVTSVRGVDFPPGAPVTLTWSPGITAAAAPAGPAADGRFAAQLLVLTKDQTGPRTITARGPGFGPVTTPFLVVSGTFGPPDLVARR